MIQAFFAASDGGHSDAVEDVWAWRERCLRGAVLKAECDPGESTSANPWTEWQRSYTAGDADEPTRPPTRGPSGP